MPRWSIWRYNCCVDQYDELQREHEKRQLERSALATVREAQRPGLAQRARVQRLAGDAAWLNDEAAGRVERHWLRRLRDDHLVHFRAEETTASHAREWGRAWPWLRKPLRDRSSPETVRMLARCPAVVAAYLAKVAAESTAATAVSRAAGAINFVCGLHDERRVANSPACHVVKQSVAKTRKQPGRKMKTLQAGEVQQIVTRWGARGNRPWQRWIACFIGVCVAALARFSDMRIPAHAVFLPPVESGMSAELVMPIRKNRQKGEAFWATLPPSGTRTLLRDLLIGRGYSFGRSGAVRAPQKDFLMPSITHVVGSGRHLGHADFECTAVTRPLSKRDYQTYLKLLRWALRDCCGFSKEEAQLFGTQSCRRTGDSLMRRAGRSQCQRQGAGAWAERSSETAYNDLSMHEKLELFAASCV